VKGTEYGGTSTQGWLILPAPANEPAACGHAFNLDELPEGTTGGLSAALQ